MFGLEVDLFWNLHLAPPISVRDPLSRQIETIGDRQARGVIGYRQRYRHLTIVLFAELAAILPRNAYRMLALLRKARVIDDPRLNRTMLLDLRQNHVSHFCQNRFVRPASFANEMQQR